MNSSIEETETAICNVEIDKEFLTVSFADGRLVSVPISWYPRLSHSTLEDRLQWRLIGRGRGIHWPLLDEDISAKNLILGQPSGESSKSFLKWQSWYQKKTSTNDQKATASCSFPEQVRLLDSPTPE